METLILPITSSAALNEGQPPQLPGPPTGNFAKILEGQSSFVAGEDSEGKEMAEEKPDVSSMGLLLPAFAAMIPRLSSFLSSVTPDLNSSGGNTLNNEGQPPQPSGPPTGMIPRLSSFLSSVTPEPNSLGGNTLNGAIPPNMAIPGFNAAGNPAFPSNLPNTQNEEANPVPSLSAGTDSEGSSDLRGPQGKMLSSEKMNPLDIGNAKGSGLSSGVQPETSSQRLLPQGKIGPPDTEVGFLFKKEVADSEGDNKVSQLGYQTGTKSQGGNFSLTANYKGGEEILFSRNEFPGLPRPTNPDSKFSFEGVQDPGGSQKLSLDGGGDLKIRSGPSLTESGKEEIYQQIGRKVIWSVHNNTEKVKITLDPPDLGNIYMEIYREKETIKATLWADNPTAKAALEASQGQLQKIMQNEGFKLEQFNVFLQENLGSFQERKETPLHPQSGNPSQDQEHEPEMRAAADVLAERTLKPKFNSHHVDVWV